MTNRRNALNALTATVLVAPAVALAHHKSQFWRLGFLGDSVGSPDPPPVFANPGDPPWIGSTPVGGWVEIPNSSLGVIGASLPNGAGRPSSKIDAWNGLVYDAVTHKAYSCWGGGHNDYWGNEVDVFDLPTGVWTRLEASTLPADIPSNSAFYNDGRPASCHNYGTLTINKTDNRIIRVGTPAPSKRATPSLRNCAAFDLDTNKSMPSTTIADVSFAIVQLPWAVWRDPVTDNLYAMHNFVHKYTRATNTWSNTRATTTTPFQGGIGCSVAVDSLRRRALLMGGYIPNAPYLYDIANNTLRPVTLRGSHPNAFVNGGIGPGFEYAEDLDLYLGKPNDEDGGVVYSVHPTTFAVEPWPTSGGSSLIAIGSRLGIWTRWMRVPSLPGGKKGMLYLPSYSSNFWFLRTS